MAKPLNVDQYIAEFPRDVQERLELIRSVIKKLAPQAEEKISYNMPYYKLNGMLISFAAWKNHIALYPTPALTGPLKQKLKPFEAAKSTLRFPLDELLPLSLITQVVKLRINENKTALKQIRKSNL